jgi:hypothetical protein
MGIAALQDELDDDDDSDPTLYRMHLERACSAMLSDLAAFERLPANMLDPNVDRYPRLFPTPFHANAWGSPAAMCAELAAPLEQQDGRRR